MNCSEIFAKRDAQILITGDSISYNRYGYDTEPRVNAYDCGAGLPSWSFALRDRIFFLDDRFLLGEQITVTCEYVPGLDNISAVPHTAVFGGRIKTLYPQGDVSFPVPFKSDRIVLYLQRRLENSCMFDVYVDGSCVVKDVDTQGDAAEFAGYGLMTVVLPCNAERCEHTVTFTNIRGATPKITLAGVGALNRQVILNGQGGRCADFFVENFDERIGRYNPDLIILSLGGNDRGYRSVWDMQSNLIKLFSKIFSHVPHCKVLLLLPPLGHDPAHPERDVLPYCSPLIAEAYDRAIEAVCQNLGKEGYTDDGIDQDGLYNIDTLRISELFEDADVTTWRFDNIHLNPHGNQVLLEAVCKKLEIKTN